MSAGKPQQLNGKKLSGKRIAILVADGFEQIEMTDPCQALKDAGASTTLISPVSGKVQGFKHFDKADQFDVQVQLVNACVEDYDGLLLPGGVGNPDTLRSDEKAVAFVKAFADAGKPIAAICHGPWTLIEAGIVRDRKMTSWPSLKTDLRNAGAVWVDAEVVCDHGVVTSRNPDDLPAFNEKMIEEFAEGNHGPGLRRRARAQHASDEVIVDEPVRPRAMTPEANLI